MKTKINLHPSFLSVKVVVFIFSVILFQKNAIAQGEDQSESNTEIFTAKHAIYGELGGTSSGYGINYSFIFHQKERFKYSAGAGFSMRY